MILRYILLARREIGLRRIFGETVGRDQAAAFRFEPAAPVWRRGIADIGDRRPAGARCLSLSSPAVAAFPL
jgi:hypothetical protein